MTHGPQPQRYVQASFINIRCTSANAYPSAADCSGLLTHHSRPDATNRNPAWSSALLAAEIWVTTSRQSRPSANICCNPRTWPSILRRRRFRSANVSSEISTRAPSSIRHRCTTEVNRYPVGYGNPTIDHLPGVEPSGKVAPSVIDRALVPWGVFADELPADHVIDQPGRGAEPTSTKCLPMFRLPTAVIVGRSRQHNRPAESLPRGGGASEATEPDGQHQSPNFNRQRSKRLGD